MQKMHKSQTYSLTNFTQRKHSNVTSTQVMQENISRPPEIFIFPSQSLSTPKEVTPLTFNPEISSDHSLTALMESYGMCFLCDCFLWLNIMSMYLHVAIVCSFLFYSILFCQHTSAYLSLLLLIDPWIVSVLGYYE